MAYETLEIMWNILKENEFHIDGAIKSEFKCTSCQNIVIKACNVPCGCRYCFECLESFLNKEEKFCLGESDYCRSELINIDKNVFIDQAANIKISRVVVKCPQESCEFISELGKIADHMRICGRQAMACPYHSIGCEKNNIGQYKMKQHFKEENVCHARLLMNFVDNWRHEINFLKTTMLDLQEENKWIKKQMESKQETILALEENVAKLLQGNETCKEFETHKCHQSEEAEEIILAMQMKSKEQNDEIKKNKRKCDEMEINQKHKRSRIERISQENLFQEELENKFDKSKENIITALQIKSEEKEQEIEKMTENFEFFGEKQDQVDTRMENKCLEYKLGTVKQEMISEETILSFQSGIEKQEQRTKTNRENTEDLNKKIDDKCDQGEKEQKKKTAKIDKMTGEDAKEITEIKWTEIQANQNCGEFLWCIQNWAEKKRRARAGIEKHIFSDPFYSHKNGYKMCLRLDPGGNGTGKKTHLSLFLYIMQGEFDNNLQFPFRYDVKFELINQNTGMPHQSCILTSDKNPDCWQKPSSERNMGFGFQQFIKLSKLSSNPGLCQNNQIWIRALPLIIL